MMVGANPDLGGNILSILPANATPPYRGNQPSILYESQSGDEALVVALNFRRFHQSHPDRRLIALFLPRLLTLYTIDSD